MINQKYFTSEDYPAYINPKQPLETRELKDCEIIIVHCTATDSEAWDDPMACINYDRNPNHISRKGCPTATYHFYINKPGEVFQLVSMNIVAWNCARHNKDSVAICINHGAKENNVTEEQYKSLIETICHVFDKLDWGYDIYGVKERIFFHRDFNSGKTCPGFLDKNFLIGDVVERLKTWGDKE